MISSKPPEGAGDLGRQVEHWLRLEGENRELKNRVAAALDEIRGFIGEREADLQRRKSKLLQTSGYKDETRAMEAELATISQLFASGRNVSRVFAEVDRHLAAHGIDDTLSRLHTRIELADARDEFMCAFHDSIRGTRLSDLLDVLYFMPYAYWRSRGLERRNYRSPSAAEILGLLEELGRRGIDCNGIDTVQLAAMIRIQLGITPRMDYHNMPASKLAGILTDAETLTRFTNKVTPLDAGFCRTAERILASVRQSAAEFFGGTGWAVPAEIEAEILQIAFLAPDNVRSGGAGTEGATDYLWLLATVIASAHATLKDVLGRPSVRGTRHTAMYERLLGAKSFADRIAVLTDGILATRWSAAKEELTSLRRRSDLIASKSTHGFDEFTELEQLKDRRSDAGKSLIKIADSLQLIEPALLDMLARREEHAGLPSVDGHLRTLDPAAIISRNRSHAEETAQIARQELDKLRALIGRITTISRAGFPTSRSQEAQERPGAADKRSRTTADGVELGTLPVADLQALLLGSLRKAAVSVRDCRSKVDAARKRGVKSELLHSLNILAEKTRRADDACDRFDADTVGAEAASAAAEAVVLLLREILTAQTNFNARVNSAKLTPAEKQPLAALLFALKTRVSDDLRDVECLRAEITERSSRPVTDAPGGEDRGAVGPGEEQTEAVPGDDAPREEAAAAAAGAPETAAKPAAASEMASLAAAGNAAMKPVKEIMTLLGTALADRHRDDQAILAAARDLRRRIAEAQELMAGKVALIRSVAEAAGLSCDGPVARFDRWQRQLDAVDEEAVLLLRAASRIARIEGAARTAAAFVEEVSAPCEPCPTGGDGGEELRRRCGRCAQALEAIASSVRQLREAREACAEAALADWRLLKGAGAYLESRRSTLDACEGVLHGCRYWIEELWLVLSA